MNNHDLLPQKNNSNKPLLSSVLFPELKRELEADPSLVGNLQGVFIMTVKGSSTSAAAVDEWYLIFQGQAAKPILTPHKPKRSEIPASLPIVHITLSDKDVLNFITGGLTGVKGYISGKLKIKGNLLIAQQLEGVFNRAGGQEKAVKFIEANQPELAAVAKKKMKAKL